MADTCPSTMDLAWDHAQKGRLPEMAWVLAERQTRGRGQFGRCWDTCAGNLFTTVHLPEQTRTAGALLPLALALCLADCLSALGLHPQIKWPNDLLVQGKKVGGILVESRREMVMAGFGVNITAAPRMADQAGGIVPGCLADAGVESEARDLWRKLADRIHDQLAPDLARPEKLLRRIEAILAFQGDWMVWEQASGRTDLVRILGLAPCGGLRVLAAGGERIVRSGRITPRIMI